MALTAKQKEGLELLCEARDSNWAHGSTDLGSFASVAVLMKVFQNLLADPENHSNRKLRTSNDKVRALLATAGVQELLIGSGFVEVQYTDGSPSVWTAKTVDRAVVQAGLEELKQLQRLQIVASRERGVRGEPMQPSILADTAAAVAPVPGAPAEAAPPSEAAPAEAAPAEAAPLAAAATPGAKPGAKPAFRGAPSDVGHVTLIPPPSPSLEEEAKPGSAEWFVIHMLGGRRAAPPEEVAAEAEAEEERVISPSHRLLKGRGGLSAAGLDSIQRHMQTFAPSGIVDLSERGLTVLTPEVLDLGLLKAHVADIFELDLHANCLVQVHRLPPTPTRPHARVPVPVHMHVPVRAPVRAPVHASYARAHARVRVQIHRRLLQPLVGLRTLDLSHNGFAELPEVSRSSVRE